MDDADLFNAEVGEDILNVMTMYEVLVSSSCLIQCDIDITSIWMQMAKAATILYDHWSLKLEINRNKTSSTTELESES